VVKNAEMILKNSDLMLCCYCCIVDGHRGFSQEN